MRISDWSSDVCSSDLYFHEEVLDLQPEDVRNFLVDTSILNELTTSACAAVTNSESARAMLDHVFASGLFLNATDRARSCYSYHKLFREMVLGRLMDRAPARASELHRRASGSEELRGGKECGSTVRSRGVTNN